MAYIDDLLASSQPDKQQSGGDHTDVTLQSSPGAQAAGNATASNATAAAGGDTAPDMSMENAAIGAAAQIMGTGLAAHSAQVQHQNQMQLANSQALMNVMSNHVRGYQNTGADQGRAITTFLRGMR